MNLDDFAAFNARDPEDMLGQINGLPDQIQAAWDLGNKQDLPDWTGIKQVLISGMGGSAIGADLLAAYTTKLSPVPVVVHRDYDLPVWVKGTETLVIASSHSGNTEETISAFQAAQERGCRMIAITTGGKLAQDAPKLGIPLWKFVHTGQPRAAVGYSFGLLLACFARLGLLPDPTDDISATIAAMKDQQKSLIANVPIAKNPAKRLAGQLIGRWVAVIGSGFLSPVARRWKGQISELAKAWAQFEFIPEANHNTLAGILNPEGLLTQTQVLFLRAPGDHPRNRLRSLLTRQTMMLEGLGTDIIDAAGENPMAQMWTCLHLGDYVSYYLAMAYGVDPTPVEAIEVFKREMLAAE